MKFSTNTKLKGCTKFDWILHITVQENLLYLTFLSPCCTAGDRINAFCALADLFLRTVSGGSPDYYLSFGQKETKFSEVSIDQQRSQS